MGESEKATCPACMGTGKCLRCEGRGHVIKNLPSSISVISGTIRRESGTGTRRTCTKCFGSGTCQTCKGTGKAS